MSASTKPIASIVIVNFNGGGGMLAECVESVRRHTRNYELVLIDNGSEDHSVESVREGSDLQVLRLHKNLGFARANNIGIQASCTKYVVFLNSDTIVTPSWLDSLIREAESSSNIGLVAPKLIRSNNHSILDSTGHTYQFQTGASIDRGFGQIDRAQFDSSIELPSCCFACALVKRAVFEQIGFLDDEMFFYYEDVDFGLRARIAGWRVVYCPNSIVYHARFGSTIEAQKKRVRELSRPYPLRIMLKNYQASNMLRYAGQRFLLDILKVAAGIKNRDFEYAQGYAREISWNISHFPLKERILSRGLRKVPDKLLFASEVFRSTNG